MKLIRLKKGEKHTVTTKIYRVTTKHDRKNNKTQWKIEK